MTTPAAQQALQQASREKSALDRHYASTAYVPDVSVGPDGLAVVTPEINDPDDDYGLSVGGEGTNE